MKIIKKTIERIMTKLYIKKSNSKDKIENQIKKILKAKQIAIKRISIQIDKKKQTEKTCLIFGMVNAKPEAMRKKEKRRRKIVFWSHTINLSPTRVPPSRKA